MMRPIRRDGFALAPLLTAFLLCMMILIGIFIPYEESQRIICRTEDAIIISLQGACLFDRYEYATGSQQGKEIVCFYSGSEATRYSSGNDEKNMVLTKEACNYAYELFLNVLQTNISSKYVITPFVENGGLAKYVKKFEITNVYEDTAYVYDLISDTTNIIRPSTDLKSTIKVEMGVDMQLPLYGMKTIKINEIGKLDTRN